MEKLRSVKSDSLRLKVYKQLKEQILKGKWKPGDKLPTEKELCDIFGVSRVTVREALQQLGILGLVVSKQGGGSYVSEFNPAISLNSMIPLMYFNKYNDVVRILEYRKIVEKGTIGLAVEKVTDGDLDELADFVRKMEKFKANRKLHAQEDLKFHYKIARLVDNPIILKMYEIMNEILLSSIVDNVSILGPEEGIRYHKKILEVLKARDKKLAEEAMEEHIDSAIKRILKLSEKGLDDERAH